MNGVLFVVVVDLELVIVVTRTTIVIKMAIVKPAVTAIKVCLTFFDECLGIVLL